MACPPLEYSVYVVTPFPKDVAETEKVQKRAMMIIRGTESLFYKE